VLQCRSHCAEAAHRQLEAQLAKRMEGDPPAEVEKDFCHLHRVLVCVEENNKLLLPPGERLWAAMLCSLALHPPWMMLVI